VTIGFFLAPLLSQKTLTHIIIRDTQTYPMMKRFQNIVWTRNTFYGTRYLSHCCVLFCIKTFFL